ncbi:MAG: NAD(P)-dependent oxidoreductase [Chloroflexi bacterium]|nr:NAD(P)-dependent oxidoreductase [Chloroflexota bacterium]
MKKVLVLGGGGFIGSNIVRHLVARGDCNVVAADLSFPRGWDDLPNGSERFTFVAGDFTQREIFDRLGGGFDEVYMMAAIVGVNRTLEEPEEVIRVNTLLTMNTLDWLKSNPVKRLLFASSSENYAGTFDSFGGQIPTSETIPLCISDVRHPRFTYAITKIHGESAFLVSAKPLNYECIIVRYQNIIGPNMGFRHAIPHIVQRLSENPQSPFKVYGSDQTRAFCYISDAVAGTVAAMECYDKQGEIYHVGNDVEITMDELTQEIGRLMGYQGDYVEAMTYPGSVGRRCPDISKCRAQLGYIPQVHWKQGLEKTVAWYRDYFSSGAKPTSGGFAPPENFLPAGQK